MRRAGLAAVLWLAGCPAPSPKILGGHAEPVALGQSIQDPISGGRCPRGPTTEVAVYQERNFYFCDAKNRRTFSADPERYAFSP